MKGLGKNQKAVVEFLKEQPCKATNSWEFRVISDNGAHFMRCIYPSLKSLCKRGIVAQYYKMSNGSEWRKEIKGKTEKAEIPSCYKGNNRVSTIWQLVEEKEEK